MSHFDNAARKRNAVGLVDSCINSTGNISVLLIVPRGHTHEAAHSLCTLLQNAECPKAFRVTIVESVDAYEKESNLLKIYKEKCNLLGRYALDFLDLIEVHQVFSDPFVEALHLFESQRKLVFVLEISGPIDFVVNWDRNLEVLYDELRSPSFGGLYCGASVMNGTTMPSFTTNTAGLIESWPLWRSGPPLQVLWPVSPLLMEYTLFKQLTKSGTFNQAIDIDRQFWTTREPVAIVERECFRTKTRLPLSKALGLSHNAEHLEIIMKYGSIAALKRASNGQL